MWKNGMVAWMGMVVLAGWGSAGELLVEKDGSGNFGTIQGAIDAAVDGDIVVVGDGVWSGDGNRDIDFCGKAITVRSENGPAGCTVDCGGSGADHHLGFLFQNGEGFDSVLEGFTIINGWHPEAGAIFCSYGSIQNAQACNPTIRLCVIRNNFGGAAGGIRSNSLCSPRIVECVIADNFSDQVGGIHFADECSPEVISCIVRGNEGQYTGGIRTGGARCRGLIANSVISGNRSAFGLEASGIEWWAYGGSLTLTNCTITNNKGGPGVLIGGGGEPSATITNCIVWGNTDNEWNDSQFYFWQMQPTITHSDIQGGWAGQGNLSADPLFVDADGEDGVAGTADDDLQLIGGSLCLDAGDTTAVPDWMMLDARGEQRIQGGIVDIGAYEGPHQGLAVVPRGLTVAEGQTASFTVRLGTDPGAEVEVEVLVGTGDVDITITSPRFLHFGPSNYDQAQTVTLSAAEDADGIDGTTIVVIRATDAFLPRQVRAVEIDNDSILYVDDNSIGSGGGADWANAFLYLQDALAVARQVPRIHEIRVAQGTYWPDRGTGQTWGDRDASFELFNGITVKGGYGGNEATNPDERDVKRYKTILSGDLNRTLPLLTDDNFYSKLIDRGTGSYDNSLHVVAAIGVDASAVLDGVVITGGTANGRVFGESSDAKNYHGGGVYVESASPTLIDCTITGNIAFVYNGPAATGGGMYCRDGDPTLTRCSFVHNVADDYDSDAYGAGMAGENSSPTLVDCLFAHNFTLNWGGGMSLYGWGNPVLEGCRFVGNFGQYGGGAIWSSAMEELLLTARNCVFSGNSATNEGGGVNVMGGGGIFRNCTFASNTHYALVAHSWNDSHVFVENCIFRDGGHEISGYGGPMNVEVWHSDVEGGWSETGGGNIDVDPLFADQGQWDTNGTPDQNHDDIWTDGDYHLKSQAGRWDAVARAWVQDAVTSPCIDAGNPASAIMVEPFPNGGVINMGAYGGTDEASKSWFGGPTCVTIVAGDINGDCAVDLADFAILAGHWLETR